MKERPGEMLPLLDFIVKNTYRTLTILGIKGCHISCTDQETREYFKKTASTENDKFS